mmetsp:Transcript_37477/g.85200  ORF Transcript_37477/g.85200 Transcript_37477/m.85200 type:complete len:134 (+) Transcript_37477:111-512(+)
MHPEQFAGNGKASRALGGLQLRAARKWANAAYSNSPTAGAGAGDCNRLGCRRSWEHVDRNNTSAMAATATSAKPSHQAMLLSPALAELNDVSAPTAAFSSRPCRLAPDRSAGRAPSSLSVSGTQQVWPHRPRQ